LPLLLTVWRSLRGGAGMDAHSIRALREESAAEGRPPKPLVFARPEDSLSKVVRALTEGKCSMVPILTAGGASGLEVPQVLHLATLSSVAACVMRHFRASLASLPLLSQPLASLPLGTWSPDSPVAAQDPIPDSPDARRWRRIQPLHLVQPNTPLTSALGALLEAGVSALPVVDERRTLLDVYARSDITQLCRGNVYSRLQWEEVTVGQALAATTGPSPWGSAAGSAASSLHSSSLALQALSSEFGGSPGGPLPGSGGKGTGFKPDARVHVCSKDDPLRTVIERLAVPGVRRLVVIHPETRRVEGVVSLSDVATYLFI